MHQWQKEKCINVLRAFYIIFKLPVTVKIEITVRSVNIIFPKLLFFLYYVKPFGSDKCVEFY